jgi:hypothetical protein|tara:strand:- start:12699 stop:13025 length:327 start_codon:yes stop_codon:yes gene_type:complete
MTDWLKDVEPVMAVFPITNGFVLRVTPTNEQLVLAQRQGIPPVKIIYAKDEVGIAKEIIAVQARYKLDGVTETPQSPQMHAAEMTSSSNEQLELFTEEELKQGEKTNE